MLLWRYKDRPNLWGVGLIEATTINDLASQRRLIDQMVRISPAVPLAGIEQLSVVEKLLGLGKWTLITGRMIDPRSADLWAKTHGKWNHRNGHTAAHNRLGMAWAWETQAGIDGLYLDDSPDITGCSQDNYVVGDVGSCEIRALIDGVSGMKSHDVWISVLDYNKEVSIEMMANPSQIIGILSEPQITKDLIRDAFYCDKCKTSHFDDAYIDRYYQGVRHERWTAHY